MRKKIVSIIISVILLFAFVGCGGVTPNPDEGGNDTPPVVVPPDDTDKPGDNDDPKPGPDEDFAPWEDIPLATEPVSLTTEILIGSWVTYYRYDIDSLDTQMRRLAQSGVNFNLFPFQWDTENWDSIEDWQEIDELCTKYRIAYGISVNEDLHSANQFSLNIIKDYYAQLDESPYCRFVNLRDEPTTAVMQGTIKRYYDRYREELPNIVPFTNLLPSYGAHGSPTYRDYIQAYANDFADAEYLSTDYYPFTTVAGSVDEGIFSDMEIIRDIAYNTNKMKTHCFIQSTGFVGKRMTNIDEIRWNIYAYLAYGFKAFSYFNYVCPGESDTEGEQFSECLIYRDGTIRDQQLFDDVADLNWEIRALSSVIMNSDASAAYHTTDRIAGVEYLPDDYFIQPKQEGDFVITYLENKDSSQASHIMIFNNSISKDVTAQFEVDQAEVAGLEYFNPATESYETVAGQDGTYEFSFAPGEGKIFRLA